MSYSSRMITYFLSAYLEINHVSCPLARTAALKCQRPQKAATGWRWPPRKQFRRENEVGLREWSTYRGPALTLRRCNRCVGEDLGQDEDWLYDWWTKTKQLIDRPVQRRLVVDEGTYLVEIVTSKWKVCRRYVLYVVGTTKKWRNFSSSQRNQI